MDRDFLLLWFSQVSTLIGGGVLGLVVAFMVDSGQMTGHHISTSSSAMGLVILLNNTPSFFVAFFAGVLADWFDRKRIMLIANLFRAIFLTIFLIFAGWNYAIIAFGVIFLISSAKQIFIPAEASMIPDIVRKESIMTANSIFNLTTAITYVLGFMIAGPLLKLMGPTLLLIVLISLFISASVATVFIRVPKRESIKIVEYKKFISLVKDFYNSFVEGVGYIMSEKLQRLMLVHNLFAQSLLFVFIALIFKLGEFLINLSPTNIGLVAVLPVGIGLAAGVILMNTTYKNSKRVKLSFMGVVIQFIATFILSGAALIRWNEIELINLSTNQIVLILTSIATILIGFGLPFMLIPSQTVIQENTKDGFLGRVYGVWLSLSQAIASIPAVIIGYAADFFLGVPTTLVWSSIIVGLYCLFLYKYRDLA